MRLWWGAALLAVAGTLGAQGIEPLGVPVTEEVPSDPDFGVAARHFGLERRVWMYQWSRAADGRYVADWHERPVASTGFDAAHANPGDWPMQARRWVAQAVTVDGKPLDARALQALGEWRAFRPNFSRLPGNLAATFQPEGDGLGSAENPMAPEIGDLRIRWRELQLPPLSGRVTLRDGKWQVVPGARAGRADAVAGGIPRPRWAWWATGAALVLAALAFARRRRGG